VKEAPTKKPGGENRRVLFQHSVGKRGLDGRGLVVGAEAARAEVEALHLAIDEDPGRMDVRGPGAVGMPLGVADIVAEHRGLPANITLHCRTPRVSRVRIAKTCFFIVPYYIIDDKMSILDGSGKPSSSETRMVTI
jgi:hypothetical protein